MLSSIDDDNPVMFFEHKAVYALKGDVESFEPIPLGKGDIKREGSDVTVIATGKMVYEALAAAEKLDKDDISVEVLDPRTLYRSTRSLSRSRSPRRTGCSLSRRRTAVADMAARFPR